MKFYHVPASTMDSIACIQDKWRELLGVVFFAVVVSVVMALVRRGVRKNLEPRMKNVSFGGLFLATSLFVFSLYLIITGFLYFTTGESFEVFFLTNLGMAAMLPEGLGCLGGDGEHLWATATPLYFPMLYAGLHMFFMVLAFLMLWGLVGFRKASGISSSTGKKGVQKSDKSKEQGDYASTPTGLLAPVLAPVFLTFGYWLDLRHIEKRYEKYGSILSFTLTLFKWICLPAAFLGTLPPSLWILGALVINNFKENLKAPSVLDEEKQEEKEKQPTTKDQQKAVSIIKVIKTLEESEESFEIHSVGAQDGIPAQLADSRLLSAGPAMALIADKLGLSGSLYAHQESCAAHIRNNKNVLLATAPLSGRTTIGDLLALNRVLTIGESVLYVCPDRKHAAERYRAFKEVAYIADWDWNLFVYDLANEPPEQLDLQMRQPGVVFLTIGDLHEHLLPNARDWDFFLRSLGLVVTLNLDSYTGAPGANLYRLARRFAKVCSRYGANPLYFATAVPFSPDIRAFAERLLGVPLIYVGPGTDTAPHPSREILTCRPLPVTDVVAAGQSHVPMPVRVAGKIVGLGHRAELYGFEETLTREELNRIDEVLLEHGRVNFGSTDEDVISGAGATAPGRKAEVVVAQAKTEMIRLMGELTRHFGADLVDISRKLETQDDSGDKGEKRSKGFSAMETALGLDEWSFDLREGDSPDKQKADESNQAGDKSPDTQGAETEESNLGENNAGDSNEEIARPGNTEFEKDNIDTKDDSFIPTTEVGEHNKPLEGEEGVQYSEVTTATILLPAAEPFVHLLMSQDLIGGTEQHQYLRLGCESVTNPDNEFARKKNLRCAMAETLWSKEELIREFGRKLVEEELTSMKAQGRLLTTYRREVNEVSGMVEPEEFLRFVGHPLPHGSASMQNVTPDHLTVLDRHTKINLLKIDRVRGLADLYPGLVFQACERRYRICNPEDQLGFDDGFIFADPYERPVITAKIRDLVFEAANPERRKQSRRRDDEPRSEVFDRRQKEDRRSSMEHSIGGERFMLWYPWVHLHEWVHGVKTYTSSGVLLDATYYGSPIETRYRTRSAVLAFHEAGKNADPKVLHSLTHTFRHILPAFVRHDKFDLDIAYMESFGPDKLPAIAFLDRHPGDAGFARSVTTEVFKHLCYWSFRLLSNCPANCDSPWGCYHCLRSTSCNASHGEEETNLDKESTLALLTQLLGGFAR